MRRVIGKLNTETVDGRMIKALHEPDEPIPVRVRVPDKEKDLPLIVGTATWVLDGDDIVADIDFRYTGYEGPDGPEIYYQDLTPHMEIYAVQHGHFREGATLVVDVAILKAIFLDDQPDAFGDLGGYLD